MKKLISRMGAGFSTALLISTTAMASMVDNQSSLSAEFSRMPARVAASDSTDAAIYNPAGTAWLEEGLHLSLTGQIVPKDWRHSMDGETFGTTTTSYVPHMFGVYRKGKLGAYAAVAAFGGLGLVSYDDGFTMGKMGPYDLTFRDQTDLTYVVPGITTGVSYQISDTLSVSGGVRALKGVMDGKVDGGDALEASADASGIAPIFGLSWKATDRLDLSMRHEMRTRLEYGVDNLDGDHPLMGVVGSMVSEGDKFRMDFPAQTAVGAMYHITPEWRVAMDGTVAWQKHADRGGAEDGMGNGYYLAYAVEHDLSPKWTLSAGYIMCDPKDNQENMLTVNPKLRYQALAAGFKYNHSDTLSFNFGVSPYFYDDYTDDRGITMEKDTINIGIGVEWKM